MSSAPLSTDTPRFDFETPAYQNTGLKTNTNSSTVNSNGSLQESVVNTAKSAMDTVQNHPITQNVTNGPVAQNVKAEGVKTRDEFADLANSRQTPAETAATGQPLTHYHSLFYRLLSWKNPRATAITYVAAVAFIFAARYLNIIRYILKGSWVVFGITAAAEIAGQVTLGNGFTSQVRPKKYFVVPRESLERFTGDIEQFINFFVIEFQRVVFAENVYVTAAAFFTTLITYYLVKIVPLWGLSLIGTTIIYFAPLVYLRNKEAIDAQLNHTAHLIKEQSSQLRDASANSLKNASETARSYAGDYANQAQNLIGSAKAKTNETYNSVAGKTNETYNTAAKKTNETYNAAANKTNETYNATANKTNDTLNSTAGQTESFRPLGQTESVHTAPGQTQHSFETTPSHNTDYLKQTGIQSQFPADTKTSNYADPYNLAPGLAQDSKRVEPLDFPSAPAAPIGSAQEPAPVHAL